MTMRRDTGFADHAVRRNEWRALLALLPYVNP
jgi:hypothetical protein